jgi:hypothetical protein
LNQLLFFFVGGGSRLLSMRQGIPTLRPNISLPAVPAVCRERPDVSMQLVAVDFLPPEVLQTEMLRVSSLLAGGRITPLRAANYSLTDVVAAMRLLAQAIHVGKVRINKAAC